MENETSPQTAEAVAHERLGSEAGQKKDGLLNQAITKALGHGSWQLWAIAHRIKRLKFNGSPSEVWWLDDKPIIEIWPPEFVESREGNSIIFTVNVPYRTFEPQNP